MDLAAEALEAWQIDDVVGAVSVHAVGGVWGTLAAGLFKADDLFNIQQFGVQLLGCVVAFIWAFGVSWLLYQLINRLMPLRATTLHEQRGLDFSEHHEVGYPEFQQEVVNRGKHV